MNFNWIFYLTKKKQIHLRYNGSTPEQAAAIITDYNVIQKFPFSTPLEKPRDTSTLNFQRRKKTTKTDIDNKKNYLTVEQLKDFLQKDQYMTDISLEDSLKLIKTFEPSSEGQEHDELGIDGLRLLLLHDEFCIMNPHKSHRVYHNMTRPLTDYFIATSHNT